MLVLASVTIITLDYHGEANRAINRTRNVFADAVSPLQRGVQAALHPLGDVVSAPFHYGELQTENDRLRAEIGTLDRELGSQSYAQNLEREVQLLRDVPFAGNLPEVPAMVIVTSTSNFEPTIEIELGSSSGVAVGMPVISGEGLVGTVTGVSGSTATVLLVTDPHQTILVADPSGNLCSSLPAKARAMRSPSLVRLEP